MAKNILFFNNSLICHGQKSKDVYGADGQSNQVNFDPTKPVLVTDETSLFYDSRVHLPVDEALARNIDYQGVLEPIAAFKNPETGETEVVFGRQRIKAARLSNEWRRHCSEPERQIPAVVCAGSRQSALDAISSENESGSADSLLGRDEDQIAVIDNCTVTAVRDTLALLDSPAAVQNAVEAGQITLTHAKALARLPPGEQRSTVADLVEAPVKTPNPTSVPASRPPYGRAPASEIPQADSGRSGSLSGRLSRRGALDPGREGGSRRMNAPTIAERREPLKRNRYSDADKLSLPEGRPAATAGTSATAI